MKIVQCWDDGVTSDIRLCELLRQHGAKASFNLNLGLHGLQRGHGWNHEGHDVLRLARTELTSVYTGFTIANHTLTHPYLTELDEQTIEHEVSDGRKQLQDVFSQPVYGFVHPFGRYDNRVLDAVLKSGHLYARAEGNAVQNFPPDDPLEFRSTCHFLSPHFWQLYEQSKEVGVFYFWGHSFEMINEHMWHQFEQTLIRINEDADAEWADIPELFMN
ncbi:MAG: polysaccharide deacetylase family protein [Reinekea sp.]|nr:polysaccharide deacetylase family protein [Reinekea sp.]